MPNLKEIMKKNICSGQLPLPLRCYQLGPRRSHSPGSMQVAERRAAYAGKHAAVFHHNAAAARVAHKRQTLRVKVVNFPALVM